MRAAVVLCLTSIVALSAGASDSLTDPKQLVAPIRVSRASYYMDGGSLACSLTDSRGAHLDFLVDRGLDMKTYGNIYIGILEPPGKESSLAHFDDEMRKQLYTLVDDALRNQFVWDAAAKKLAAKRKEDAASVAMVSGFDEIEVRHLFSFVERRLGHPYDYVPEPLTGELTQSEAHFLAMCYVERYLPQYAAQEPQLKGDIWECTVTTSGRVSTATGVLHIARKTGSVSYEGPLGSKPSTSAAALKRWIGSGQD